MAGRLVAQSFHPQSATDAQLLARFIEGRDQDAFAELVRRHGPMVMAIARRRLANEHDAEEAFQATFFALAKSAPRLRNKNACAGWLQKTAYACAKQIERNAARERTRRERMEAQLDNQQEGNQSATARDPRHHIASAELREILDAEIARLPDKLRAAIVLCDLEGLTQKQAARRLDIPASTVNDRVSKGRRVLRDRLIKRGVTLTVAGLASCIGSTTNAATTMSHSLIPSTTRHATLFVAGKSISEIGVSLVVIQSANIALRTMMLTKIFTTASIATSLLVACLSVAPIVSAMAQDQHLSFIDTFDDMNIVDGMPVSWRPFTNERLDATSGDLVLSSVQGNAFAIVEGRFYENVSMRTQVGVLTNSYQRVGFGSRVTPGSTSYFAAITSPTYSRAPNSLAIGTLTNIGSDVLASVPTSLDPTLTDVTLQFDTIGNQLTLSAWVDGGEVETVTVLDNRLTSGQPALFQSGTIDGVPTAAFRYFEVHAIPEPSTSTIAGVLFLLLLSGTVWSGRTPHRARTFLQE